MACYSPLPGFKGELNANGKRPVVWRAPAGTEKQPVPCGKCVGCRLAYSKSMAVRCMHESQMHADNCFVTLTFNDDHLPPDSSLDVAHVQLFMKRFRKACDRKIRYFFAGEYGGRLGRPHYHGLIFGYDFPDRLLKMENAKGDKFYESQELSDLWPFGFHSIGDLNFATAAYVARYCLKKVVGKEADEHYVNRDTGVLRKPEFTVMSRRPGIGATWFDKYRSDVFPSDQVIVNGGVMKPPRYYDNLLDRDDPDLLESLKIDRAAKVSWKESTVDRLMIKEQVKLAQIKSLKRSL